MITTKEKPIRYVMRDHQGEWVENLTEPGIVCIRGLLMTMTNEYFKFIPDDGICIEIYRYPYNDFLADCYYVEPTQERKQHRKTLRKKDYKAVCSFAVEWLNEILIEHRETIEKYYPQLYASEGQIDLFDLIEVREEQ